MKEEFDYIPFALPLVRKFFTEPSTAADDIVDYGIYRAGLLLDIEEITIYRQLTYKFIQQGLQLPYKENHAVTRSLSHKLIGLMQNNGYLESVDYNGFDWDNEGDLHFDCVDDINLLVDVANNDEKFKSDAEEWYRLYLAQEKLGLSPNYMDCEQIAENYKRLHAKLGDKIQIPTSCKIEMLLDMGESPKTERERVLFCYYLGIRSLIGKNRKIVETTSDAIKRRMIGAKNEQELSEILKDSRLSSVYTKWTTYSQYKTLTNELMEKRLVKLLGMGKRTYASCVLLNRADFVKAVADIREKVSSKSRDQRYKDSSKEERKMVMELLTQKRGVTDDHPPDDIDSD